MRKEISKPHDISTEIGQEKPRRSNFPTNYKALLHTKSYITWLIFLRNPSKERVVRRAKKNLYNTKLIPKIMVALHQLRLGIIYALA